MANNLFHCLKFSVKAYGIMLEDCNPKAFHKVFDGLGSPHSDMEKTGNALFSLDGAHVLSDELFRHAAKGGCYIWS